MAGDRTRSTQIQFVETSVHESRLRSADLVGVVKAVLARRAQGGEDAGGSQKCNEVGLISE